MNGGREGAALNYAAWEHLPRKRRQRDFPDAPLVENPPPSAEHKGPTHGPGT